MKLLDRQGRTGRRGRTAPVRGAPASSMGGPDVGGIRQGLKRLQPSRQARYSWW